MVHSATNGLRSKATQHLLHTYDDEGNHRDGEDHVGDEPVAVFGATRSEFSSMSSVTAKNGRKRAPSEA